VFHYPQSPSATSASARLDPAWYGTPSTHGGDSDSSSSGPSSDTDAGQTDDDNGTDGSRAGSGASGRKGSKNDTGGSVRSLRTKTARLSAKDDLDEDVVETSRDRAGDRSRSRRDGDTDRGRKNAGDEWDKVFGFSSDGLSKILTPGRSFNKRRFEVGIDQLVFVGAPRFVREDGLWKKKKKMKQKSKLHSRQLSFENRPDPDYVHVDEAIDMTGDEHESEADLQLVSGFDPAYGHGLVSGAPSGAPSEAGSDAKSTSTNGGDNDMGMFNIVFVLSPPALEYHIRVQDMYDSVAKKFAKALKFEQANNNYVYKQSRLILSLKDKAKEQRAPSYSLWPSIIRSSALAKAMVITFEAISTSKIAHINLSMNFDTSFQIPQAISTPCLASSYEPQMPGLWLTTATLIDDEDSETTLSPHSALLLLEDDDTLLKEVENDAKELSGPLSYFIRNLTPTKSLLKISQTHSMKLPDLQFLARHLIYWRRARAIPPLRPRDTYIVSPNADMRALKTAIPAFASRFPTLPSLPKILHSLSGVPKPYGLLMPSRDHRQAYMDILAWLMRGGWVTQLRTFGWVRVPPEVKAAVAAKMHEEAEALEASQESAGSSDGAARGNGTVMSSSVIHSPNRKDTASPRTSVYLSPGPASSDAGSPSTDIPLTPRQQAQSNLKRPSALHINRTSSPKIDSSPASLAGTAFVESPQLSPRPTFDSSNYSASLVHSPQKANALESRWIEHIWSTFSDEELKELWPRFLKYFDGRHALEIIPVREGLKKKRVSGVLARLIAGGWIMTVRHW
jgi:nitrogen permease regulator 3-like protein